MSSTKKWHKFVQQNARCPTHIQILKLCLGPMPSVDHAYYFRFSWTDCGYAWLDAFAYIHKLRKFTHTYIFTWTCRQQNGIIQSHTTSTNKKTQLKPRIRLFYQNRSVHKTSRCSQQNVWESLYARVYLYCTFVVILWELLMYTNLREHSTSDSSLPHWSIVVDTRHGSWFGCTTSIGYRTRSLQNRFQRCTSPISVTSVFKNCEIPTLSDAIFVWKTFAQRHIIRKQWRKRPWSANERNCNIRMWITLKRNWSKHRKYQNL